MALTFYFLTPTDRDRHRAAAIFVHALQRVGWLLARLALVFAQLVEYVEEAAAWALREGFRYPPRLATVFATERALAPVRARARSYERRKLERSACRDMSAGVGLRLAV